MQVSRLWHTIAAGIWASLKLGTTTLKDVITNKLERNQSFLDVLVDTELDCGDFTPSEDAYDAIFAAIQAQQTLLSHTKISSRGPWHTNIHQGPQGPQDDIVDDVVNDVVKRYDRRMQVC